MEAQDQSQYFKTHQGQLDYEKHPRIRNDSTCFGRIATVYVCRQRRIEIFFDRIGRQYIEEKSAIDSFRLSASQGLFKIVE